MFDKSGLLVKWFVITIVIVLLLAGCARPTPTPTPTPTATPRPVATPTPIPPKGEGQVVVFGQGVWEKPFRDAFIAQFEKEFGCKVTYFPGISSAMVARMKAEAGMPTVDVVNMNSAPHLEAKLAGLLDKNNRSILTNLKAIHPKTLDPDDIGAPFVIAGGPVIAVRNDKLQEKNLPIPSSWLDLANPAYKDKVGFNDISVAQIQSFVAHVSRALGGNEVNDYARAFEWIETKLKPNMYFVGAPAEWQKLLEEGSIWIGVGAWGRAAQSADRGAPLTLVWAKEGTDVDPISFAAVKGGPNPICAQLWMNFTISKEVQESIPTAALYGPTRTDVAIPDKVKALVIKPSDMDRAVALNRDAIVKNKADWVDRWNRIFAK
ncbi:MAG: extracellular solute-binding protein [Chloroflexi bacterium]|nr:extracellular solute-binding protein [Chloroflexota bacterium]